MNFFYPHNLICMRVLHYVYVHVCVWRVCIWYYIICYRLRCKSVLYKLYTSTAHENEYVCFLCYFFFFPHLPPLRRSTPQQEDRDATDKGRRLRTWHDQTCPKVLWTGFGKHRYRSFHRTRPTTRPWYMDAFFLF